MYIIKIPKCEQGDGATAGFILYVLSMLLDSLAVRKYPYMG